VWVEGLSIASGVKLRAVGSRPLRIVAAFDIRIDGEIDLSSHASDPGAGSASNCPNGPEPGISCTHGGSGGGGGGFGAAGGDGGPGGVGHNCGSGNGGTPGGEGGIARDSLDDLVGGCAGRIGGFGDGAEADRGQGGYGGGGLQLVAHDALVVNGIIHAGGAGGLPGLLDRAGAGGGGSGGMIQLDGSTITIAGTAVLAANGGGGGGGCNDENEECPDATAGEDGKVSAAFAVGGLPAKAAEAGTGGAGGHLTLPEGQNGTGPMRGGGGGGGGVGWIRFNAIETQIANAIMSPAAR
jgi:hypothetical protein